MVTLARICEILHDLKPVILMVTVQTAFAGVNIFYKLASNDGMNLRILVAYRFLFAAAFITPLALYVERNKRPKLTWKVLTEAFLCGLFGGSMAQNFYSEALALTSATFASAITNLIPAITFILALCFRMEKLDWRKASGIAKIMGTILGIGGAMLLTFYKGPELNPWKTHVNLLHHGHSPVATPAGARAEHGNKVLGSLFAIASCFSMSLWLIIQAKMAEIYPCPYSSTALMTIMGSIQGVVFALCTDRDPSAWKLGWNIRLLTVAYCGIWASGVIFVFLAWCVNMRGPLYASAFNPLMLVIVAIAGSLFLNEKLHLGSVLGAILIVCGLYFVLWGKGKEAKKVSQLMPVRDTNGGATVEVVVASSVKDEDDVTTDDQSSVGNR